MSEHTSVSESSAALTADPLFVGATRPPMRWGVTYSALLFNLVFTLEAFLLTGNLLTLLIAVPIHGLCALLCAHDPRYFDLLAMAVRTRLPAYLGNGRLWRAVSYAPLPLDAPDARARRRTQEICCWCAGSQERRAW